MNIFTLKIVKDLLHFDHHYNPMIIDHFYSNQCDEKIENKYKYLLKIFN